MNQTFQVVLLGICKAKEPVTNDLYRRFINYFPCPFRGVTRETEPMQTGPHELGAKAGDITCLPGCRKCHREFDVNLQAFAARYELAIPAMIQYFHSFSNLM